MAVYGTVAGATGTTIKRFKDNRHVFEFIIIFPTDKQD